MNTFGSKLRLTTFGESHGPAIGGIIDGFPAGFKIDFEDLRKFINERAPGQSLLTSQRKETDIPEFLSGIDANGVTLGTPIGFIIRNNDTREKDYSELAEKFRPNHADFTYEAKYGIRDWRGGGRSSARETANWVVAGALAKQWLSNAAGISFHACLSSVGKVDFTSALISEMSLSPWKNKTLTIPDEILGKMEKEIEEAKKAGDSVGGVVTCVVTGLKAGFGSPVFGKLQSRLAAAMMSINAAKGFEYGLGFSYASKRGSETLDIFSVEDGMATTKTNFSGGLQGGISNGMPIYFNVAFKPTPTIMQPVETITKDLQPTSLKMDGRHDPCVALRAVPVVKALAALVVADFML